MTVSRTRASWKARRFGLALLATVLLAATAPATDFYVDPVAGVDDATARDGLSTGTAWKSITFALAQLPSGTPPFTIHVGPGTCNAATGETFPITLPPQVSLAGAGPDQTTVFDASPGDLATVLWQGTAAAPLDSTATVSNLMLDRQVGATGFQGKGLELLAKDSTASPAITNVSIRGSFVGLFVYAYSSSAAAAARPVVTDSTLSGNFFGAQGLAYTLYGSNAAADPVFTNDLIVTNFGDGLSFVTEAGSTLTPSRLAAATSTPAITHCTIADNIGSGILLDSDNAGYKAGNIKPSVVNNILADNGDFALFENQTNNDPSTFQNNLVGGNGLGYYLDEGVTYVSTIGALNALFSPANNIDGEPAFVQGATPDWHLRADSPGIDAGISTSVNVDIDGDMRPLDSNGDGVAVPDVGADEVPHCAVTAALDPAAPADRCGTQGPLAFDASASAMTTGFTCSVPLDFQWYADGVPVGTGPTYTTTPTATTTYAVVVSCADFPHCQDAKSATVTVHSLPTADANVGGPYVTCMDWDAVNVALALTGTATPVDPATVSGVAWTTDVGVLTSQVTLTPVISIPNTGTNQVANVTLTVTDSNTCTGSSVAQVYVWRGPHAMPGGPYTFCQDSSSQATTVPLTGTADIPVGSSAVNWAWETSSGRFDDPTIPAPHLTLTNVPFSRTITVALTVTDNHGCSNRTTANVTLAPSPTANPGGPYQSTEDASGTTSFTLDGSASRGQGTVTYSWTTDLGTFRDTGTTTSILAMPTLDLVNTGSDQLANVCLTVGDSSACTATTCTGVSVLARALLPPNDITSPLLVYKGGGTVTLHWGNSPLDATHDLATRYEVWQSTVRPAPGTWALRPSITAVAPGPGVTETTDATLLGPDASGSLTIFMKIVAANAAGWACADPTTLLPNCP